MDLMIKNYLERSENEIIIASSLKKLSSDISMKNLFEIDANHSIVISHSYYVLSF